MDAFKGSEFARMQGAKKISQRGISGHM